MKKHTHKPDNNVENLPCLKGYPEGDCWQLHNEIERQKAENKGRVDVEDWIEKRVKANEKAEKEMAKWTKRVRREGLIA